MLLLSVILGLGIAVSEVRRGWKGAGTSTPLQKEGRLGQGLGRVGVLPSPPPP